MALKGTEPGYTQDYDRILYRVKPNDTLSKLAERYHPGATPEQITAITQQWLIENPTVTKADRLKVDQLIHIQVPQQYCSAPTPTHSLHVLRTDKEAWLESFKRDWDGSSREERDLKAALLPLMLGAGSAKMSTLETTFSTNRPLLREILENYETYKAGRKTKGQYDYRRQKLMTQLTSNLGPTNLLLNGGQAPSEVLRISRTKGSIPTQPIEQQLNKMAMASRLSKAGGVVLTGVGLGIACQQIAHAPNQKDKNEIFVEAASGALAGVAYGLAASLTLAFFATPVGWAAALVIGAGGSLAGYTVGRGALRIYNWSGASYDLVDLVGVDQICTAQQPTRHRINSVYSNNAIYGR